VVWDMGPSTRTCYGAGREWKFGHMPSGSTTDCSYRYEKVSDFEPDGEFHISAQIFYDVDYTCTGNCDEASGTLGDVPGGTGTNQLEVGERQSVLVN
ncbi:MAG: hypothetical protein ACRD0P_07080, partial [Stackebrandtia sp.]